LKRLLFFCGLLLFTGLTTEDVLAQTEPRLVLPIGHTGEINSAVFSPDGKLALTASQDGTARIYEMSSGNELQILSGNWHEVNSAVFSPDGQMVLTACNDNTARIFEVENGNCIMVLGQPLGDMVYGCISAEFSPDGKYVLTTNYNNIAQIFDVRTGKKIQVFGGIDNRIYSALFSPDSKLVLTANNDYLESGSPIEPQYNAHIYNPLTGADLKVLKGHEKKIESAVFSSNGKLVLTASADKTARIYEVSSGKELHVLSGHTGGINSAVFSPDGKFALTASSDNTARIYDVMSGKEVHILAGHTKVINSAVFSPDGKYVLTASWDNTARIYDVISGKEVHILAGHTDRINSAVFSPDGKFALTASKDAAVCVWQVDTGKMLQNIIGHSSAVASAEFSLDGKSAITFDGYNARIYEITNGKDLHVLSGHTESLNSAIFSPDGNLALTTSLDDTIRVYKVSTGEIQTSISSDILGVEPTVFSSDSRMILSPSDFYPPEAVVSDVATGAVIQYLVYGHYNLSAAAFSEDGKLALTAGLETADIHNVATGEWMQTLRGEREWIKSAMFSSDGKLALLVFHQDRAGVYEVSTGKQLYVLNARNCVFSNDSKYALTTSWDNTARIYDVMSGKEVHILAGHTGIIESAVFSSDGKYVLTASSDKTARIYEVSTGQEVHVLSGHTGGVWSASFSPDGKYILTTGADHKTILWETATGKPLYTRLQLKGNDWLVYDEHYRFDGTPGAIDKLYFVCGLEVIELGQMKDALYVPGLVSKILNGEDINYKKLSDLDICGALPIIEKTNESASGWEFNIEQRRWPIVRLEVMVDGKTVKTISPDQLKFVNAKATLRLTRSDLQQHLKSGEENKVTIIAITENDKSEFKSRGEQILVEAQGEKQDPNFYMLMIGVNDYKDDALDLRFPVQDARAFGSALESSARKLLGNDKVFVYNVQSKTDNTAVYTTPERAGVMKALEDIGKKAKTNDVLFIFFAGHGVMQGADNTFTFLTADASKLNPVGISTTDLKSWLSPEGPFHMMPNKTVLVYDACNSGQAAKEIMADLAMARDDDATERQRQIEDLGDKSGVFILSASAPNQSAYELPHLGQGMLTYSLLTTLKNNPGVLDEDNNGKGFLNLQKWFLETEREQSRLMQSLGLNQDAQPYGTANIRIGVVDDEVRNGIALMAEKPLVYCSNARDDNDEDPLDLKQAVNAYLETATARGTSSKLGYIKAETSQANIVKLVYNASGDKVQCRILIFKNKVKINELNITTTTGQAAEDVVKAVEGAIK
jgi:WD40 repeat protein